jgi:Cu(I)/Ag(I) efflux system membrane fusion protein
MQCRSERLAKGGPMSKTKIVPFLILGVVVSFFAGIRYQQRVVGKTSAKTERKILYYVDPMHPAYKSDKPGIAPDCGMELVPVYANGLPSSPDPSTGSAPPGMVMIRPEKQQMLGIHVIEAEKTSGTRTLRTLGRVAADETHVFRVTTPVDGLVRSAGPIVSGSIVRKDEVLGTFYNRDFLTAQQAYLYALNTMDRFKENESDDQLKLTRAQMRAAEENLEFLGMGETQMQEIARTRQIAREIELRSPVAGLVVARNVFPGLRFDRGTELFRIVELDHVWILANVFAGEAEYFRPGRMAKVSLPGEDKRFGARISSALPQFDAGSRTLQIRLEADNPGFLLRPDMFVDVELSLTPRAGLSVPAEAVLDSGLRKTVFVDRGNGLFEPRTVETGWRTGDRIEIVKGLMAKERVVVDGNFFIDSESRLKAAAAGAHGTPAKDPVCGMEIDVAKAKDAGRVGEFASHTYYFCSDTCKQKFAKDPARYLEGQSQPAQHARATAVGEMQ